MEETILSEIGDRQQTTVVLCAVLIVLGIDVAGINEFQNLWFNKSFYNFRNNVYKRYGSDLKNKN